MPDKDTTSREQDGWAGEWDANTEGYKFGRLVRAMRDPGFRAQYQKAVDYWTCPFKEAKAQEQTNAEPPSDPA